MIKSKKIAVIIPAYNEEKNIGLVIEAMPEFVDDIIVIDDGSIDQTSEVAARAGATVNRHENNRGVGAAFQSGKSIALKLKSDIIVNIDADGQFNPKDIERLIQPILQGTAEFVTASRFRDKEYYPRMSKIKFWGNQMMSSLISQITGQKFYDVSCGFRAYTRDALLKLNLFGDFTYTQETFLYFAFKKLPIAEIPIRVRGTREHGKSRVASNLFRYAYQTLKIIIKTFRDYQPFRLFMLIAVFFFFLSLLLLGFLLIHYIQAGRFFPHRWAGFVGAAFGFISLLSIILGFILDIFARMRINQEEILYYLRKNDHDESLRNSHEKR